MPKFRSMAKGTCIAEHARQNWENAMLSAKDFKNGDGDFHPKLEGFGIGSPLLGFSGLMWVNAQTGFLASVISSSRIVRFALLVLSSCDNRHSQITPSLR
jgi:hypothetical protein